MEKNIGRFDVPVDEVLSMEELEALSHMLGHVGYDRFRHGADLGYDIGETATIHVLEDDANSTVVVAGLVKGDDVGAGARVVENVELLDNPLLNGGLYPERDYLHGVDLTRLLVSHTPDNPAAP